MYLRFFNCSATAVHHIMVITNSIQILERGLYIPSPISTHPFHHHSTTPLLNLKYVKNSIKHAFTTQKIKSYLNKFFSRCKENPQETADLFTFTKEFINGKLHFLCSAYQSAQSEIILTQLIVKSYDTQITQVKKVLPLNNLLIFCLATTN